MLPFCIHVDRNSELVFELCGRRSDPLLVDPIAALLLPEGEDVLNNFTANDHARYDFIFLS